MHGLKLEQLGHLCGGAEHPAQPPRRRLPVTAQHAKRNVRCKVCHLGILSPLGVTVATNGDTRDECIVTLQIK